MNLKTAVVVVLGLVTLARAQAPQFRILDNPLPANASPDAAADLDGDGDVDLVNQLGVFTNDGHARFTGPIQNLLSFPRKRTVLADFDGDGMNDCLSIDGFNNIRLDHNAGGLTFVGPQPVTPPLPPVGVPGSLATADVDLDGDVDVLIGMQTSASSLGPGVPVLWLNNGSGILSNAPAGSVPGTPLPSQVILRDLDANGYPDAIFYGYNGPFSVGVAFNVSGTFTTSLASQWFIFQAWDVATGDFDGDGLIDLAVASNGVWMIMNSPSGFTAVPPLVLGPSTNHVAAIDVDGDGTDELAVTTYDVGLTLHSIARGDIVDPPIQSWPNARLALRAADNVRDLDGDGDRDLFGAEGNTPILFMGTGNGTLERIGGHAIGVVTWDPRVGRIDADDNLDIFGFTIAGSDKLVTGINDGDGYFHLGSTLTFTPPYPFSSSFYSLNAFDQSGDGDADIYAAGNVLTVSAGGPPPPDFLIENVNGTLLPALPLPGAGSTTAFQAFDFDGDGDQDILLGRRDYILTNGLTAPMRYIRNDGPAGLVPAVTVGTNHATYDLDLGDFDGNGTTDVFQTNWTGYGAPDSCVVYLNPGNAAFVPVVQSFAGWFTVAADLNADGMTDLVVDGHVYFSAGGGAFTQGPALATPLSKPASLADVDLDGDLDLVELHATVMLNSGGANFGPPVQFLQTFSYVPWNPLTPRTSVFDVDRDGDPDIVAPGPVVLTNTARQIAHGSLARPGRPASIDLYGAPNGSWFLYASAGTASFPLPPYGHALIDPASAILFSSGALGGPGSQTPGGGTLSMTVPNDPALVGWTSWWQAIVVDAATAKATNRIAVTVLDY